MAVERDAEEKKEAGRMEKLEASQLTPAFYQTIMQFFTTLRAPGEKWHFIFF